MKLEESIIQPDELDAFKNLVASWRDQQVAVAGHVRPDGDCIGSQVALCRYLLDQGVKAVAVNADPVPRNLHSFVKDTPLVKPDAYDWKDVTAVSVDCADARRMGAPLADALGGFAVNIDHHISNPGYATLNIVVPSASATAEILAELFIEVDYEPDRVTANALYVGIATDTGQFRFNSTSPRTFDICRWLCSHGANPAAVANDLYEQEKFGRLRLLQYFLSTLRLELNGRVCVGLIKDGWFEETGTTSEDSEGFVDYARAIEGVDIGVYVEEQKGVIKGSFRAKDPLLRVDELANRFNGGGHACAAGFRIEMGIKEFYPRLTATLAEHLRDVENR